MIRDTSLMDQPVDSSEGGRGRRFVLAAAALGVVLLGVAAVPAVQRWAAADRSVERARLRLATVERGELLHEVAVQGRVVAASRPTLFSPAAGILSLRVREGEWVETGDALAVVDSPELESNLQQELATLDALRSDLSRLRLSVRQQNLINTQLIERLEVEAEAARRQVERTSKLVELGVLNVIELESARDAHTVRTMELEQARSSEQLEREMLDFELADAGRRLDRQRLVVTELERRVDELVIRTPFDGLVATVAAEDRDVLARGQPVLGVVDLSDLELEVAIPEAYAGEALPGIPAVVRVGETEVPGRLVRVAPEVRQGQVEGRVAFDRGPPEGLRQNQRLSTRLVLDRRADVLRVRRGPFLESLGGRQAYAVEGDLATLRNIRLGAVSVTEVEILEGVEAGEELVISDLSRCDGATTLLLRD